MPIACITPEPLTTVEAEFCTSLHKTHIIILILKWKKIIGTCMQHCLQPALFHTSVNCIIIYTIHGKQIKSKFVRFLISVDGCDFLRISNDHRAFEKRTTKRNDPIDKHKIYYDERIN